MSETEDRYKYALSMIEGTFVTYPIWRKLTFWQWRKQLKAHVECEDKMREIASEALGEESTYV